MYSFPSLTVYLLEDIGIKWYTQFCLVIWNLPRNVRFDKKMYSAGYSGQKNYTLNFTEFQQFWDNNTKNERKWRNLHRSQKFYTAAVTVWTNLTSAHSTSVANRSPVKPFLPSKQTPAASDVNTVKLIIATRLQLVRFHAQRYSVAVRGRSGVGLLKL